MVDGTLCGDLIAMQPPLQPHLASSLLFHPKSASHKHLSAFGSPSESLLPGDSPGALRPALASSTLRVALFVQRKLLSLEKKTQLTKDGQLRNGDTPW